MKVGSLVFATEQGLGYLARAFHKHGIITDVRVVCHGRRKAMDDWYPRECYLTGHPSKCVKELSEFCASMDAMLFFETPFEWELLNICRERGVLTTLMTMYECTPRQLPSQPDMFLCPSRLDLSFFPVESRMSVPVPVDTDLVPYRARERAEVFVHNAGHGGLKGRNGTAEVIKAWKYVKSPAELILRVQDPRILSQTDSVTDSRIKVHKGTVPCEELWNQGDVFLFPEKFNGLSLPLQEAYASGMLVMAGNRFPMNEWLPKQPLIDVKEFKPNQISPRFLPYSEAVYDPEIIAARVDEWYGRSISDYSRRGLIWREDNSWRNLHSVWQSTLKQLIGNNRTSTPRMFTHGG